MLCVPKAATHYHALPDAAKDLYAHFIENLKATLFPAVCKEMFYADVTARLLHEKVDPALYLDSLRELLEKADPILSAAAKEALRGRQFLTGLPEAMRFKLLEHNPTSKLTEMVSFCKQLLATTSVYSTPKRCHAFFSCSRINDGCQGASKSTEGCCCCPVHKVQAKSFIITRIPRSSLFLLQGDGTYCQKLPL